MMSPVLKVTNLTKAYDGFTAVDGISFTVNAGETVGLLGPNGAGKTTTTNMLLGLLEPTTGSIEVFGLPFPQERTRILQRMNFAASYALVPGNLTVYENMLFFALLYGQLRAKEKIETLLQRFQLASYRNQRAGRMSSGENSRVNLAKMLLNDPELLLLDEPMASLDPAIARDMRARIKEYQKEKSAGILWTSHNMFEVEAVCDRVLFIHHGRIIAQGTPPEVMQRYHKENLEEVFVSLAHQPLNGTAL